MGILAQFLLRLTFGLAFGMSITTPRRVSSGFFRNNLYVTLGLTTLAALALAPVSAAAAWFAALAALSSFFGSTCWLYEAKRCGFVLICAVALFSLCGAWVGMYRGHELVEPKVPQTEEVISNPNLLNTAEMLSVATSGLVLGLTFSAMLLGHWYLNAPGMDLAPLRRLIAAAGVAVAFQAMLSGTGLGMALSAQTNISLTWILFVVLRWTFGVIGVAVLLWMARETLSVPNTQSATGILYVAVIGVFVGELTALLLSAESKFPL